ncbi:hypothetical protein BDF20DRAFT_100380 [Mycotypha africana]|uniref:uncharacterized protein n=1 Tax=Mycotypha africana TaxID=64632 RepID=UPI002301B228|nr:uncharacterized protein BDF20DRAFT_100380 [Mycotypha africana]KAI8970042.1 hypothetical protein BDF20DRAFT_100380 [Mycotypha africana]
MSSELGLRMFDPIDGSTQVKTIDQALVKQVFQRNTMVKLQNHDNCLDNSCSDIVSGHSMASKSEKGDTDASTQSESSSTKSALTTTTDSTDNELQRIRQFDLTFIPEQKFVPIIPSQLEVLQYEKDIQSKTLAELENSTVEQLLKPFSQSNDITLEENSKDVFIADFIKVVLKYEIDLDFAIVCTNATSEKAIISALDFWGFCQNRVRFAPLGRVVRQSLEDRRFYGVIMKIRKSGKRVSYYQIDLESRASMMYFTVLDL